MTKFTDLSLPSFLTDVLQEMGITDPTPVQEQAIPIAIEGTDVLVSASTGTGKTLAYCLPLVVRIMQDQRSTALILLPTRELAVQVHAVLKQLLIKTPALKMALLIGGEPMVKQYNQLRARSRIVVGTPGRITDHLNRGTLMLSETRFLVLDETDRMLEMGFREDLEGISERLPSPRQTFMFSATFPANIVNLSKKYLTNPTRISIDSLVKPSSQIKQEMLRTSSGEKYSHLLQEIEKREGSIIIFVKTKRGAEQLMDRLKMKDHRVDTLHGDLSQRSRERAILGFRSERTRIMVATDIAARGLDIPHIRHVINYDLPQQTEDYVHRIGRTGRAGAEGWALSLVSNEDLGKWRVIDRMMNGEEGAELPKMPTDPRKKRPSHGGGGGGFSRPSSFKPAGGRREGGREGSYREGGRDNSSFARPASREGGREGAREGAYREGGRDNSSFARPAPREGNRESSYREGGRDNSSFARPAPREGARDGGRESSYREGGRDNSSFARPAPREGSRENSYTSFGKTSVFKPGRKPFPERTEGSSYNDGERRPSNRFAKPEGHAPLKLATKRFGERSSEFSPSANDKPSRFKKGDFSKRGPSPR